MAFFRKWKNYTKHKKLSEEFGALAKTNSKKKYNHSKCEIFEELNGQASDAEDETAADDYYCDANDQFNSQYIVKYLGNTLIQSAKSEEATANAVKSIITKCKGKNTGKKLQKVNLSISSKGIDASDIITTECILQISIYKISYCSADATHSNVFAFIASDNSKSLTSSSLISSAEPSSSSSSSSSTIITADIDQHHDDDDQYEELDKDEHLICYAFLCNKRKIAQNITLTVARSFECAYKIWRDHNFLTIQNNKQYKSKEIIEKTKNTINNNNNLNKSSSITEGNTLLIDFNHNNNVGCCDSSASSSAFTSLSASEPFELSSNNVLLLYNKDQRTLLQNTWVSFDDQQQQQQQHSFSDNFPNDNFEITTTNSIDNNNNTTNRNQQSTLNTEHIWNKNIICL